MPPRGSFERRLLLVLALFALLPTITLLGVGAFAASEAVLLTGSPAAWERVADSGGELIRAAEASGDAALAAVARQHREELSASLTQARRWEYLLSRGMTVLPFFTLGVAAFLGWLALRAARGMARGMTAPIRELVDWSGRVARDEQLPTDSTDDGCESSEFTVLREAFRSMSAELAVSRQKALEAERMRTWVTMARSVAHELKNPLTPMRLAVHTLSRSGRAMSVSEQEALDVITAEASRLDELARSFGQFGRLPDGPPSEIDLREMLEYLLRSHLPDAVSHRLLAPMDLPRIEGHYDALSRAFVNLVLNALDAVQSRDEDGPRGNITLKVRLRQEDRTVEVRVLDNGPGIPVDMIERIWDPDFTTKSRGTGLGLALVRQTVESHGGRVGARNRPEGGAEFIVILPVTFARSEEEERRTTTVGSGAGAAGRSA